MILQLDPSLEAALNEQARKQGMSPEELALHLLKERLRTDAKLQPRDEWERELLESARPWGVSLSNEDLSSERLYD